MKFQNILFDLDGTLTDPALGITNCVMYALKHFNIEVKERSELFKFIGPPLVASFKEYYGFSEDDAQKALCLYRERFSDIGLFENEIYDGIEELLDALTKNGARLFVATSKPDVYAEKILEHFNIKRYFAYICGNTLNEDRPKKEQVIAHLKFLYPELNKTNTVMVGDRCYDVEGAHSEGFKCIGVEFGYGSQNELINAGADFIVKTVSELKELLLKG